jgi:hypothetical protein
MVYLGILLCLLWLYRHFASWAMSHRHCLLRQYRNTTLPSLATSILCLIELFASWATLPLGLASWATLPLGLLCLLGLPLGLLCLLGYFASWACLLGYFTSWATLPLGLLCLLVCFASWATLPPGLSCFLGYFNMLPFRPCLIDFDNAGILICLLGCANTRHLLVCEMIRYVNIPNRDTL